MANPNYQYIQPILPEGWSSSERQFYNQLIDVLDGIYAWRGRLTVQDLAKTTVTTIVNTVSQNATLTSAQISDLTATVANLFSTYIASATITSAQVSDLYAQMSTLIATKIGQAEIDGAQIKTATVDLAKITGVTAGSVIAASMVGGKLQISNLGVTDANIVSLTAGEIIVKGSDGKFYSLSVDANGTVVSTPKLIGNSDVGNSSIVASEKIVENSVTAKLLNVEEILANSALIDKLTASQAFISELTAATAFLNAIKALGSAMDLSANDAITLLTGKINAAQSTADNVKSGVDQYRTRILIDQNGVHITADDTQNTELNLRPDMIRLLDALGNVCVTIAQQMVTMPSATVSETLTMGGGVWRALSNGSLALMKA